MRLSNEAARLSRRLRDSVTSPIMKLPRRVRRSLVSARRSTRGKTETNPRTTRYMVSRVIAKMTSRLRSSIQRKRKVRATSGNIRRFVRGYARISVGQSRAAPRIRVRVRDFATSAGEREKSAAELLHTRSRLSISVAFLPNFVARYLLPSLPCKRRSKQRRARESYEIRKRGTKNEC